MKKIKYFIPSFIVMILIFMFSSQTSHQSSNLSSTFMIFIQNNLHIPLSELFIRKLAHVSEYALLTYTLYYGFKHTGTQYPILSTLLISFLYACSDEFHQLFISGRSGQWLDVLIDTCGSLFTSILVFTYNKLLNKKN